MGGRRNRANAKKTCINVGERPDLQMPMGTGVQFNRRLRRASVLPDRHPRGVSKLRCTIVVWSPATPLITGTVAQVSESSCFPLSASSLARPDFSGGYSCPKPPEISPMASIAVVNRVLQQLLVALHLGVGSHHGVVARRES
jgi:hypothetical protein